VDILVAPAEGGYRLMPRDGHEVHIPAAELARAVADREGPGIRWVWADARRTYTAFLAAGIRVGRAHDLRLAHTILRGARACAASELATAPANTWDTSLQAEVGEPTLLDELASVDEPDLAELLAELDRQDAAVGSAPQPGRLRLLVTAESVGSLVATEIRHVGLPWDVAEHDRQLTALLGPRPLPGGRPAVLVDLVGQLQTLLRAPGLNPDSQPALLTALHSAGIEVKSTRQWELEEVDHPAIAVLLQYKKLARLLSANGWSWLDTWVTDGRLHPDYVPGGVVTGRWATQGSGALQLPKQIRSAVVADPGWRLVVADAAQLEPRVLAAMSGDQAMAAASRAGDMYDALVAQGVVDTRPHAKIAMLAAMYGATTGEAATLLPRLVQAYPHAMGCVARAAAEGERGGQVTTWLGRTSPVPGEWWRRTQDAAAAPDATEADTRNARRRTRDWGRFTRNFVVQGTAAEWALCWLAAIRRDLAALPQEHGRADLVYFLHDEVIVHAPEQVAEQAAAIVRNGAAEAGRLLFGDFPVVFPVDLAVVRSYAETG